MRSPCRRWNSATADRTSRSIGATDRSIIVRHLFPNILSPIIVVLAFGVPRAIFTEAALSFIGIGVDPQTPSWGSMIHQARGELINGFYWQIGAASLAMFILVLAFTVFADALQDALDPKGTR